MHPPLPTDPDAYTVVITRTPADGPVTEIAIHAMRGGQAIAVYAGADAVDDLLRLAAEHERTNPHDRQLPSSRAIILAAMDDCGIVASEEEDGTSRADDEAHEATRERAEAVAAWAGPPEVDETTQLRAVLRELLEWESRMGGFEAPCWDRARNLLAKED